MKSILYIACFLISQSIFAESRVEQFGSRAISIGSLELTLPQGWQYDAGSASGQGAVSRIYHSDSAGTLQIKSLAAPGTVTRERLRALTNLDSSIELNWQMWGDFTGYQHDYVENSTFYRLWWLTNQEELLFLAYSSDQQDDSRREVIDGIVNSLSRVN